MARSENFNWNATEYFENLTARNKFAAENGFRFFSISGLEGLFSALQEAQSCQAFVCVSDTSDGVLSLENSPNVRRVKTVFFAMRHAVDSGEDREECLETIRELFRQFMSVFLLEKTRLEQRCIYPDMRISLKEIDKYFFTGCACAYAQIAVKTYTDLRFNADEWND